MEEKKFTLGENLVNLDKFQIFPVLVLFVLGVVTIFSAGAGFKGRGSSFAVRQLLWGGISAAAFLITLKVGYARILSVAYHLYALSLVLLLGVTFAGLTVKGSQRWLDLGFFRFQPTEFVKITLILVLSKHLCRYPPVNVPTFLGGIGVALLSGGLVLIQPDAGSAIVFAAISFVALGVAGAPWKYPAALMAMGVGALPFLWSFLKEYQKRRMLVFLDPWIDPLGAGYNVIQSRIAVGSGGLFGKGFMEGLQSKLRFLPEPHTDFIFSVYSEEFGFVGAVALLFLFGVLFWRLVETGLRTKDSRGKVLIAGISTWIWFHMVESIGMSMGLLPVTGLPLPFVSYGGSSLLCLSIALALAQSVFISSRKSYR